MTSDAITIIAVFVAAIIALVLAIGGGRSMQ